MCVVIAAVWAAMLLRLWDEHPWAVPGYLVVAVMATVLAETDQRTRLLPNRLTYPAFGTTVVLLGAVAVIEGEPMRVVNALGAAGVSGAVFTVLAWRGGMGFGDVKFVLTLATALGWLSWSAVATGAVAAFTLCGLAAAVKVIALGHGRKATLAFGPWLALGTLAGILTSG